MSEPGFTELESLGDGNFGRVVLASQDSTGAVVAVKYLFDWFPLDEFRGEAAAWQQLNSPYVVRLHEFIEFSRALVMEAVPGVSLHRVLHDNGALPPEAALAVFKNTLLGLADAHAADLVHRDLKSANVLVTEDGQTKLVDFGTAALAGESGTTAADIYAATCVFFECLTGHPPYEADDPGALRHLHRYAPIPFGEVPEPLWGLLNWGMAKDPAYRPGSAEQFADALEAVATETYGKKWERRGRAILAADPAEAPASGLLLKSGAVVLGLAVLAAGVVFVVTAEEEPPPAAPPQALQQVLTVAVEPVSERVGTFTITGDIVQVHGYQDLLVGSRVNQALRRPFDDHREKLRQDGTSKPQIVLQTDELLSVRYDNTGGDEKPYTRTVTIALDEGKPLGVRELLTPDAVTDNGLTQLSQRIDLKRRCPDETLTSDELVLALAPDGVVFVLACQSETVVLPYARMTDLLAPEVLKLLPDQRSVPPAPTTTTPPPKDEAFRFGGLNLRLPTRFSQQNQGLEKVVVDGTGCADPKRYYNCKYFLVTDNAQASDEQPKYEPGKPYRRSANGRACNAVGRKDLKQDGAAALVDSATVKVGDQDATYEKWTVQCVEPGSTESKAELTQRIWFVPSKNVVIEDEWGVAELEDALAKAVWR
ncbi:serine/threonine-protein kinase [Amycolatopsis sp. 195334CR]|uniref:protein kinase domain-containing protein n=1 Tax=Amycolatopsis sp. 195334CR TaxID=2814588 RepID=UPI001A8FE175|nr:serine/threonine-protein kinase [Amycolatopsis sp. 195334CR]MBN6035518.1 serine/threonine protein kinase [Amycolatopsis sp. 195334CR]